MSRDLPDNPSPPPIPLHVAMVTTMVPNGDSVVANHCVAITNGTTDNSSSTHYSMEDEVVSDDLGIVASSALCTRGQQYRGNHHETTIATTTQGNISKTHNHNHGGGPEVPAPIVVIISIADSSPE